MKKYIYKLHLWDKSKKTIQANSHMIAKDVGRRIAVAQFLKLEANRILTALEKEGEIKTEKNNAYQ